MDGNNSNLPDSPQQNNRPNISPEPIGKKAAVASEQFAKPNEKKTKTLYFIVLLLAAGFVLSFIGIVSIYLTITMLIFLFVGSSILLKNEYTRKAFIWLGLITVLIGLISLISLYSTSNDSNENAKSAESKIKNSKSNTENNSNLSGDEVTSVEEYANNALKSVETDNSNTQRAVLESAVIRIAYLVGVIVSVHYLSRKDIKSEFNQ